MRFKSCLSLFGFFGLLSPASDVNIFHSSVSFHETHIGLMNSEYLSQISFYETQPSNMKREGIN